MSAHLLFGALRPDECLSGGLPAPFEDLCLPLVVYLALEALDDFFREIHLVSNGFCPDEVLRPFDSLEVDRHLRGLFNPR